MPGAYEQRLTGLGAAGQAAFEQERKKRAARARNVSGGGGGGTTPTGPPAWWDPWAAPGYGPRVGGPF
jgi:hypothetical protein